MLTLFRFLSRCPLWILHGIGWLVGWVSYSFSNPYRQRFKANVAQAGVPATASQSAVGHAGRMLLELPYLWMRPSGPHDLLPLQWEGQALIEEAHALGKGLVLMTPHMGCFEVTAQGYAQRFAHSLVPITVLYRPARKAWLRPLVDTSRERPGLTAVPANLSGVRQMIRALRRGETVGLLPDQVPPDGMGVWAPFFGKPAYTMTLAARLVQQTGAAALLIWGERLPWGRGYTIRVSRLIESIPPSTAGAAEAASVINRAMERLIRQCPQQYLWSYDRYKTAPAIAQEAREDSVAAHAARKD
ncbi:MAG: lysophospholipid acyltransferase family protein [Pseudorhodobacter sp.]|nr:lysophospholipid acyltransferase family protein [Rhizobacter sp.]